MLSFKKILASIPLLSACFISLSQPDRQLQDLRAYVQTIKPAGYDSTLNYIDYTRGVNINYLYPLYQLFRDEKKFRSAFSDNTYYEELSEAVSFNGDYASALAYQLMTYDSNSDEAARRQVAKSMRDLKDIQHVDAKRYISFVAKDYRVIMINEAHNKPLHRAFTLSLLDDLYKKGFRYLAMEMLNNSANHTLNKLTPFTGHYCAEPVAGELIRTALDMGYQLVSYEDTAAEGHTATQRDSIQAHNIYKVLLNDPNAKIIVHAGYGHIAEKNIDSNYIPMGMAFKKISGIDPLTIDQVNMTEGGDFSYGKIFYDAYIQKFALTSPSIALIGDQPLNVTNSDFYDLCVIHPQTVYRDLRPTWLALNNRRQPFYIKPPKNTFLVQAYYQLESFGNKPGQVIPADQTYVPTSKGNYLLYLRRGKYIIVFRDMQYKMIKTQHVEL